MFDLDLFDFFRYTLGTIVTIYATVITLQADDAARRRVERVRRPR